MSCVSHGSCMSHVLCVMHVTCVTHAMCVTCYTCHVSGMLHVSCMSCVSSVSCVLQSAVIRDLEGRVQQLTSEAQTLSDERNVLAKDKMEAEGRIERLESDLACHQNR